MNRDEAKAFFHRLQEVCAAPPASPEERIRALEKQVEFLTRNLEAFVNAFNEHRHDGGQEDRRGSPDEHFYTNP